MTVTPSTGDDNRAVVERLVDPPLGTVLTFRRGERVESFTWTHSHWSGRSLVRSYLFAGFELVNGRAGA